jgi:hypothetical protein
LTISLTLPLEQFEKIRVTTYDQRPGRWCSKLRLPTGAFGAIKGVALDRTALLPWINFVLHAPAAGVAVRTTARAGSRAIRPVSSSYRRCRRAADRRGLAKRRVQTLRRQASTGREEYGAWVHLNR